jgi:hypothetical protein
MNRGYFSSKIQQASRDFEEAEDTTPMHRKRKRNKRLTILEICSIIHGVIVKKEKQYDVAKEYRISP